MNIFVLNENPRKAALDHADIHVSKMILESTQMLCTVAHAKGITVPGMYKPTHHNHPCTLWLAESDNNMIWLAEMVWMLSSMRKTPQHKSIAVFNKVYSELKPSGNWESHTKFRLAMPDELRSTDAVSSYRNYYKTKKHTMSLKYISKTIIPRDVPSWL